MQVDGLCPKCRAPFSVAPGFQERCAKCAEPLFPHVTQALEQEGLLNQCPICGAEHCFRQKDFNRKIGVGILVIGIALAYWTFGISILFVTLIDWLIAQKVGDVGICYRCRACFRGPTIEKVAPFNLSLHDYYKSLPPW